MDHISFYWVQSELSHSHLKYIWQAEKKGSQQDSCKFFNNLFWKLRQINNFILKFIFNNLFWNPLADSE